MSDEAHYPGTDMVLNWDLVELYGFANDPDPQDNAEHGTNDEQDMTDE